MKHNFIWSLTSLMFSGLRKRAMKTKISFLALVCLAFAFLLALPSLAGTWRNDFEDKKVFEQEKKKGIWDEYLNFFSWEDGEVSGESRDVNIVVVLGYW